MKKHIYLDLDCTTNTYLWEYITDINSKLGTKYTSEDILEYDTLFKAHPKESMDFFKNPDAYRNIVPLSWAVSFIRKLQMEDFKPIIITSTYGGISEVKNKWVKEKLGLDCVIHTEEKHKFIDKDCFLIDDYPKHIHSVKKGILFNWKDSYPWCRKEKDLICCTNYDEIWRYIK